MMSLIQSITPTSQTEAASKATQAALASNLGNAGNIAGTQEVSTDPNSFSNVMASMGADVVGNLRKAESISLDAVQGKANTREVVDALMTAEQSLQTAVAIRDKVVQAYLEITRMQI